ncbi:hypothetical protein [Demetria terragena]|uniref:hypothetical protein n=1 Tax=Demetria terragena TaxID=63959 RepID=UPI000374B8B8|nr:hypothetical protein [Demetria terragena]
MTSLPDAIGRAILADTDGSPITLVRRAAEADQAAGDLLQQAVTAARAQGHSWTEVGEALNLTRQAAQQRFGKGGREDEVTSGEESGERWLGPVTGLDEMAELALAGDQGWHTIGAGMLRHRIVRTSTRWEHRRILWGPLSRYEAQGWQVGCRAFPWIYLIRDTGEPVTVSER